MITYRNEDEHESIFSVPNFTFEPLFHKLNSTFLVDIFTSLLEERPTFFVMKDISDSALIIQAFVELLKPMEWNYVIVPHAPEQIANIVSTPFACIIGVPLDVWLDHCSQFFSEMSPEAVVFYLDSNEVQTQTPLKPLPYREELEE